MPLQTVSTLDSVGTLEFYSFRSGAAPFPLDAEVIVRRVRLFGTGDPKLMAGGISQALVTTVLGLVVALPLWVSHSVIAYMARSIVQRLDEQCAGVLARAAEQQDSER